MGVRRLLSVLLVVLLIGSGVALRGVRPAWSQQSGETLILGYYQILNAGLRSGDFSAMASVYAPDATLTHSTPQGETIVLHGLSQIIAFYHRTYLSVPGISFVRDTWYALGTNVVLNYEHTVGSALRVPARCSHLFVIRNGRIAQLYWVVYFAGRR